jgi:hypothetical protein
MFFRVVVMREKMIINIHKVRFLMEYLNGYCAKTEFNQSGLFLPWIGQGLSGLPR